MVEAELWRRIEAHPLDREGAGRPFSKRLADENGWGSQFAGRVIFEYKRFIFLGVTAGHPVSPSKPVDEVWHLHLLYTQDYWDALCGGVLGSPFHHRPSEGGQAEAAKFDSW